jgi:hypothetical protein
MNYTYLYSVNTCSSSDAYQVTVSNFFSQVRHVYDTADERYGALEKRIAELEEPQEAGVIPAVPSPDNAI